jgi:hypothetical protein
MSRLPGANPDLALGAVVTDRWVANDALTDYYRSDSRIYQAAQEVGLTDEQWWAIKNGG